MTGKLKGLQNWTIALLSICIIAVLIMIIMDVDSGTILLVSAGIFLVMAVGSVIALVKARLKHREAGAKHGHTIGTERKERRE